MNLLPRSRHSDAVLMRDIATKLINDLRTPENQNSSIARERGAYIIYYVQADKVDDAAIKLYESVGTKQDVFHFDIAP